MSRRASALVVFVILTAVTASAAAAAQVTLILRSGDRVRGELIDLTGSGFVLRVRGAEQQFERGEVAALNFAGGSIPPAETKKIQDGRTLVVLRGGESFYGRLADIGGTNPLRLSFSTPDGDRDVDSGEVARIYFSRWEGMTGAASAEQPALDPGGDGVTIPANPCWTNTGRTVRQGQRVAFNGTGEIQLSPDRDDIAGVAGSRTGRIASAGPLPGSLAGALVGRVGNSRPFGIGDQTGALGMPVSGQLFLGVNDDYCGDNRGQFKVQINILR